MHVSKLAKLIHLLSVAARRPVEAYDRILMVVDGQTDRFLQRPPAYEPVDAETVAGRLFAGTPLEPDQLQAEMDALEAEIRRRMETNRSAVPIKAEHDGDFLLARLCYLAARLTRPAVVLETGVAAGVTSTFLLAALEAGGAGALHSIDLPPLGPAVDDYVGLLIPDRLRSRWHLHRGITKRMLPSLLPQLGTVDLFVHDSLHTFRNMTLELNLVTPYLRPGGVVIADDIDANPAFLNWANRTPLAYWATVQEQEKSSLFGLGLLGPVAPSEAHPR